MQAKPTAKWLIDDTRDIALVWFYAFVHISQAAQDSCVLLEQNGVCTRAAAVAAAVWRLIRLCVYARLVWRDVI